MAFLCLSDSLFDEVIGRMLDEQKEREEEEKNKAKDGWTEFSTRFARQTLFTYLFATVFFVCGGKRGFFFVFHQRRGENTPDGHAGADRLIS